MDILTRLMLSAAMVLPVVTVPVFAQDRPYSPQVDKPHALRPLWGEVHLHTDWSADAIANGTRIGPDDALRFAQGEEITSNTGLPVRLSEPYDFMMVADHSDALGGFSALLAGDESLISDLTLNRWREGILAGGAEASAVMMDIIQAQSNGNVPEQLTDPEFQFDLWHRLTTIVDSHNQPGKFTALIGYEWTSNYGGGNNLHRNIVYRDGKDLADLVRPLTTFDTTLPRELWKWMAGYEETTGGRILAIPHNGNLSNGLMFATEEPDGLPMDAAMAAERARWEPLYELTQTKGTSEQHPSLAPADEFANFEIWDKGNMALVAKTEGMIAFEYAREALKRGLALQDEFGVNPFKFGLIGSSDSHTGISSIEENSFFGKFAASEPSPERSNSDAFNFDGRIVKD
ncbi:MAG: DUF3604 domain-containing protein, partial [Paracoccus sp. (in: a-proteobacteria)]